MKGDRQIDKQTNKDELCFTLVDMLADLPSVAWEEKRK